MKLLNQELLKTNIQKIAEYDLLHNKVFGSAYCVYQKERMIYKKCFGYTSVESEERVTEDTLFRLASMTKPITSVAILILVDKGLLSLSEPIYKILPEFAELHYVPTIKGKLVDMGITKKYPTVQNLLTHTSGFDENPLKYTEITEDNKKDIESYVSYYLKQGLDYEPGSMQKYNGTVTYDILAKIIEKVSGIDYQSFLQKEIFESLEMKDTVFMPSDEQWKRMVSMHTNLNGKSGVDITMDKHIFQQFPCTHYLGGAGLASTLCDYAKFAKMLINNGVTRNRRLLSEETFALLCKPQVSDVIMPGSVRWGLGVRVIVDSSYQHLPVGTYGWSGAYGSHFWIDPENEVFAIFLKNSRIDGGSGNESARQFERAVNMSFK